MDHRFRLVAGFAAEHHAVVSVDQLESMGVTAALRHDWVRWGMLRTIGRRSYAIGGSPESWRQTVAAALADLGGTGAAAGRSAARLLGLDGFTGDAVEMLVRYEQRMRSCAGVLRSTRRPLDAGDLRTVDGLRTLSAERLILDGPLFRFSREEFEQAIDGALRLRLISELRLRRRVQERASQHVRGGRALLEALVDMGGESALERRFLSLVRQAGLIRPVTQRVYRSGSQTVARVDFEFADGLVVEVAGHGAHASRRQRQHDAGRSNELVLVDRRILTFTYEHVFHRPAYVVNTLRRALGTAAAS